MQRAPRMQGGQKEDGQLKGAAEMRTERRWPPEGGRYAKGHKRGAGKPVMYTGHV